MTLSTLATDTRSASSKKRDFFSFYSEVIKGMQAGDIGCVCKTALGPERDGRPPAHLTAPCHLPVPYPAA